MAHHLNQSNPNYYKPFKSHNQGHHTHRQQNYQENGGRAYGDSGGYGQDEDNNREERGNRPWTQSQQYQRQRGGYNQVHQSYKHTLPNSNYRNEYTGSSSSSSSSSSSFSSSSSSSSSSQHPSSHQYHHPSQSSRSDFKNFNTKADYIQAHTHEEDSPMPYAGKSSSSHVNSSTSEKIKSTHITFNSPSTPAVPRPATPPPLPPSTPIHHPHHPHHPHHLQPIHSVSSSAGTAPLSVKSFHATPLPQAPPPHSTPTPMPSIPVPHSRIAAVPLTPPQLSSSSDLPLQSVQTATMSGLDPDPVSQLTMFVQKHGLPAPTYDYHIDPDPPARFFATITIGERSARTEIPYKSKKEAKKVASEMWIKAYRAFQNGPPSHKGKTVTYIPENTPSAPVDENACPPGNDKSNSKISWATQLNVLTQKLRLNFPEVSFRQVRNLFYPFIKCSYLDINCTTGYKTRKEGKEAAFKLACEELMKKELHLDSQPSMPPSKPASTAQLPPTSVYAPPFYANQYTYMSAPHEPAPSAVAAASAEEDIEMDPDDDNMEVKDFMMATAPMPGYSGIQSFSTKDLLQEFCRRAGLEFRLTRASAGIPTIFEITIDDNLNEIDCEEDGAARKMLSQIADVITKASSNDKN